LNDLETATTADLVAELHRRYPTLVVAGLREYPGDAEADERLFIRKGHLLTAIGLMAMVRRAMVRRCDEVEREEDE
jgi:hypothetical protein